MGICVKYRMMNMYKMLNMITSEYAYLEIEYLWKIIILCHKTMNYKFLKSLYRLYSFSTTVLFGISNKKLEITIQLLTPLIPNKLSKKEYIIWKSANT